MLCDVLVVLHVLHTQELFAAQGLISELEQLHSEEGAR